MKDCSVVTATYELEDGFKGTIGIIGPKRMDYEKVVETLRVVKEQLSNSLDNDGDYKQKMRCRHKRIINEEPGVRERRVQ